MEQRKIEFRVNELRVANTNDDGLVVTGLVNQVGTPSQPLGRARDKFIEVMTKGVFKRAIEQTDRIDMLLEHDPEKMLASTDTGTLELWEDDKGLQMRAKIVPTSWGKDAFQLIKSGLIKGMSFGFNCLKDRWDGDTRYVEELELFEVSAVRNPAYLASNISARGLNNDSVLWNTKKGEERMDSVTSTEKLRQPNDELVNKKSAGALRCADSLVSALMEHGYVRSDMDNGAKLDFMEHITRSFDPVEDNGQDVIEALYNLVKNEGLVKGEYVRSLNGEQFRSEFLEDSDGLRDTLYANLRSMMNLAPRPVTFDDIYNLKRSMNGSGLKGLLKPNSKIKIKTDEHGNIIKMKVKPIEEEDEFEGEDEDIEEMVAGVRKSETTKVGAEVPAVVSVDGIGIEPLNENVAKKIVEDTHSEEQVSGIDTLEQFRSMIPKKM